MSKYEARITKDAEGKFFALVVRIDRDGQESVLRGYEPRHFKTHGAAVKSTDKYLNKIED